MLNAVVMPLVLLMNGLGAGVLIGSQLGGYPLLAALPPNEYVFAHAFFASRYDPFMPICLVGTVVGDVVLASTSSTAAVAAAQILGAVFAASTVLVSITKNVPINRWVKSLDPARLPQDFGRLDRRQTWGRWNAIRGALVVLALVANCLAVALLV